MPSSPRDTSATWRSPARLCQQLDWSKPRLIVALLNRLPCRIVDPSGTLPPGYEIEWADPLVQRNFDVEAGEVKIAVQSGSMVRWLPVGIEVQPPVDEVPAPSTNASAASPALKKASPAAEERCFRAIMQEHPKDPPSEPDLLAEMKRRLNASPDRERVRDLWRTIGANWKRPRGAPRKKISAKNSAE